MRRVLCLAVAAASAGAAGCSSNDVAFHDPYPWPLLAPYSGPGTGKLIVANAGDDSLTFYQPDSLAPVTRIPIGPSPVEPEAPRRIYSRPGLPRYFVLLSNLAPDGPGYGPHGIHGAAPSNGYVVELRATDNAVLRTLRVDPAPGDLQLTPDGKTLVVSHFDQIHTAQVALAGGTVRDMDSRLVIIDATTFLKKAAIPVCPSAHAVVTSADSTRAYVACYATDELAIVALDQAGFP